MAWLCSRQVASFGVVAAATLLFTACSRTGQDPVGGCTISGKVTYRDAPVIYGFVVFYDLKEGLDQKNFEVVPAGVGKIEDGKYSASNILPGSLMVCVVTDPDVPLFELIGPRKLGLPFDPRKMGPGEVPGKKDGPPKGGDPKDSPPLPPAKDNLPKPMAPPAPPDAAVQKLSAEQKQILREIHAKYGQVGASPLHLEVAESDRTFDIILSK